ncbi:unknown similar to AMEV019 [Mythimna separata entomopoxvirus 'L']|uniref:RNA ligase domain-containing protein n=1 Tax=Mythimna separata entomopoxvirus 'L' TaxID=1293572 RepID=A0A916NYR1_9POXV|nr:unknown similar to AMEV019 [Mythimna separata entomopoxvirus 'L']CCU56483.1 unknown similar to AMEV019 [Mythimna separata entomopoxvirus 'L']
MAFIKLDVGSKTKGYSVKTSDNDYEIYIKASKNIYLESFSDSKKKLTTRNEKTDQYDVGFHDLYKALIGINKGSHYHLGVFGTKENIPDEMLYNFIKKLTKINIPLILSGMAKFEINKPNSREAKKLLALLYNLSYADYWLKNNDFPNVIKMPEILDESKVDLYNNMLKKRVENKPISEDEYNILKIYRENILERIKELKIPDVRKDIDEIILMYVIKNEPLYIPDKIDNLSNINEKIYPSIKQLTKTKNVILNGKYITIQEKLDGCNFRIIFDNGKITYGSRHEPCEDKDFMGYNRIKAELENITKKLYKNINLDRFIVYGELIGSCPDLEKEYDNDEINYRLIVKNRDYLKNNDIQYYAYDIRNYDGENNNFIDFETVQIILKVSGFRTIPYETVLYNDFITDIKYKSILFNHNNPNDVEGYIIRYNNIRYKVKEGYSLHNLAHKNILFNITDDSIKSFINDDINENNILQIIVEYYYNLINEYNKPIDVKIYKIFGKIFGIINKKAKFDNKIYKIKLNEFLKIIGEI